jgi:hypothetical protein
VGSLAGRVAGCGERGGRWTVARRGPAGAVALIAAMPPSAAPGSESARADRRPAAPARACRPGGSARARRGGRPNDRGCSTSAVADRAERVGPAVATLGHPSRHIVVVAVRQKRRGARRQGLERASRPARRRAGGGPARRCPGARRRPRPARAAPAARATRSPATGAAARSAAARAPPAPGPREAAADDRSGLAMAGAALQAPLARRRRDVTDPGAAPIGRVRAQPADLAAAGGRSCAQCQGKAAAPSTRTATADPGGRAATS